MDSEHILSVEDLAIDLGGRRIVETTSFTIGRRETPALVGESGSGKTMTALSVMGLLPRGMRVASGRILFEGRDLLGLSAAERRGLSGNRYAMIFQEPMSTLNPVMTVGYQVREALKSHVPMTNAEAEAEAVRIFERVQIPAARSRMNDYPHAFSGGMRQRIIIAAAIICKPDLLIADEPTTALDVTIQAEVLGLLRGLQDEYGMSMLFITHDMGVVATMADRVIVMRRGEMVEAAPVGRIFAAPEHPYTRELIRSSFLFETGEGRETAPAATAVPAKPLLRVEGLTTRFDIRGGLWNRPVGRVHAVEDVSFALHPGETLALVGESGSGKSTTGRALVGLSKPSAGTIHFKDRTIRSFGDEDVRHLRTGVQMVFQDPFSSLNPRIAIADAIGEPMLYAGLAGSRREARRLAGDYLEKVGLDPRMGDRYPHEFSGGQRQRISIARAISLRPDILVADEAVSALDVTTKVRIIDLLRDIQRETGIAILFISHDFAAVNQISHRVAVMYLGRIVEIGPRDAILKNPVHDYTRRLIAASLSTDPEKRTLPAGGAPRDLASPVRGLDYEAPTLDLRAVGPDHFVLFDMRGAGMTPAEAV